MVTFESRTPCPIAFLFTFPVFYFQLCILDMSIRPHFWGYPLRGAKMSLSSVYEATALDLACQNIRLVELQPASESDSSTIKCNFECFPLSICPPYVALSYTWGLANRLKEIQINNCRFMIRENLWWFLHHMRLRNQRKLFWIDALCIDQSNILERNHQVNLMRQIYSNV